MAVPETSCILSWNHIVNAQSNDSLKAALNNWMGQVKSVGGAVNELMFLQGVTILQAAMESLETPQIHSPAESDVFHDTCIIADEAECSTLRQSGSSPKQSPLSESVGFLYQKYITQ